MRPTLRLLFAALVVAPAIGCSRAVTTATPAPASTVVVLVRHAEKAAEPGADPTLSAAGFARAAALAERPEVQGARAVYATQYRRTQLTAAPLAARRGLTTIVTPVSGDGSSFARELAAALRARPAGDTVVVVGHSNTVPAVIAALGGPTLAIDDAEYARLFVVTLDAGGAARLRETAYGAATPAPAPR